MDIIFIKINTADFGVIIKFNILKQSFLNYKGVCCEDSPRHRQ